MSPLLIALLAPAVLAAKPLPRGTVLTAELVVAEGGADVTPFLGKQLRRPAFAGRPIAAADLAAPDAVTRQSAVNVVFRRSGLTLSVPGRAMTAGAAGDTVTVLVEGKRRPMRAVVTASGEVEVAR